MAEALPVGTALLTLRRVAEEGDWNACREATLRLLSRLPAERAWELTRAQVARRLPCFERHQPEVRWPREFIAVAGAQAGEGEPDWPEEDEFPGPGANSFIAAVEALRLARRLGKDDARRAKALVDAISEAILAELAEHWGSRHPSEWARWYQGDMSPAGAWGLVAMMGEPETVTLQRRAWLEVASRLEEELLLG
jgi:hypothetical protein